MGSLSLENLTGRAPGLPVVQPQQLSHRQLTGLMSLFPLVPDQRTHELVHRSWRLLKEGSEGPLLLTDRPEETSLGRRKVACGLESRLDLSGFGVADGGSSGSFLLEGRFSHHLTGEETWPLLPFQVPLSIPLS